MSWYDQIQSPPNLITLGRIACTPLLSYWIIHGDYQAALAGCVAAAVSDYADGYLAKQYNMKTVLGSYLDPLADKVFINSLAVSVWYKSNAVFLPTTCMTLWLAKDVILMAASSSHFFQSALSNSSSDTSVIRAPVPPVEQQPPFHVSPTLTSKINTFLQFMTLTIAMVNLPLSNEPIFFLEGLWWVTSATTVASAWSYIQYDAFVRDAGDTRTKNDTATDSSKNDRDESKNL